MEQLDRAMRYLERIREIYAGTFAMRHDRGRYEDDVVSFLSTAITLATGLLS